MPKFSRRSKIKDTAFRHSVGKPIKTVFSDSTKTMSEQLIEEREKLFGKNSIRK